MKVTALIVAGGKGLRMKQKIRKQYLNLVDSPVFVHTLRVFDQLNEIDDICLVVPETDVDYCRSLILGLPDLKKEIDLTPGGRERQDSVYNGLRVIRATNDREDIVVIHDGVRPFVSPGHIKECISEAGKSGACILGVPAFDTLKRVDMVRNTDKIGKIDKTVQRDSIWLAQTPQAFKCALIMEAHESAKADGYYGTDDASLVEYLGHPVKIVCGSKYNIKITTKEDLLLAEAIFQIINHESGS